MSITQKDDFKSGERYKTVPILDKTDVTQDNKATQIIHNHFLSVNLTLG